MPIAKEADDGGRISTLRSIAAGCGLLLVVGMAIAWPPPAGAADWHTWELYMRAAQLEREDGRLETAAGWLQDAVREAERQDPRSPQLVRSLARLGEIFRIQGRHAEADAIAARLGRTAVGDAGSAVAVLERYAAWLIELGRDAEGREIGRKVQRLRQLGAAGTEPDLFGFSPVAELRNYAQLLRQHRRDADAHQVDLVAASEARRLIERYDRLRNAFATRPNAAPLRWADQIGAGQEALLGGLYPEAEALFQDALKTAQGFAVEDVRLAFTLSLLAVAARAQGKGAESTAAVQRALPVLERAAGSGNRFLARSLTQLAHAHLRFGFDPAEALPHLQRSLALLQKDVAGNHPAIALHLGGLAAASLALGRRDEAARYLERALQLSEHYYLPEHLDAAAGLARVVEVYVKHGEHATAEPVARRLVAVLQRVLDPGHPQVARAVELQRLVTEQARRPAAAASLAAPTTVPFDLAGNAMLVHATVNGSQRARLLVDTGASVTLIRPLLLRRLGVVLPHDAPRRRVSVVGGQTLEVPVFTLSLELGEARVGALEVAVMEALPGAPELDGLLGADFLERFKVTLDRTSRRMTLEPLPR